jgi:acyl-CoA synthetase (AMP-forming)/AMP-acid ligase II
MTTLVDILRRHAAERPETTAYTFLGEAEEVSISYADLDQRARAVAAHLLILGRPGDRALLLYPQGIEYLVAFWGCLYAGMAGIPLYPPSPKQGSLARMRGITEDAGCRLALSTRQIAAAKRPMFDQIAGMDGMAVVATDEIAAAAAAAWTAPEITTESLAYLQYTSGSTSAPKGVMISHANLLHNLAFMHGMYKTGRDSVLVTWAPIFHDMGLIMGTLLPLYAQFPCVLMSPAYFAQRPARWLEAITRFRATISFGSNFAFDLAVDRIVGEQREALDLSTWRTAINGSEPVRAATLERFAAAFAPQGFRRSALNPSYGLAEATLVVSCMATPDPAGAGGGPTAVWASTAALAGHRLREAAPGEDSRALIGCGRTCSDGRTAIVDPQTRRECPEGAVGEIWVSGPSVSRGYWNRPVETAETFGAHISASNEGPFLRTGDLGCFRGGELFITGRLKDVIIIRGRNHYPQDIEATVENSHPRMRRGNVAAFAVENGDEERLIVVQEIERGDDSDLTAIVAAARRAVAEVHEVQPHAVVLIKAGTITKTTSGKIQRRACREAWLADGLSVYATAP